MLTGLFSLVAGMMFLIVALLAALIASHGAGTRVGLCIFRLAFVGVLQNNTARGGSFDVLCGGLETFRVEAGAGADLGAVLVEHEGDDGKDGGDTADEGAAAADAHGVEHLDGEEGGGSAAGGAHDCVCGDGGGGVHEVGVDEVVEEADEEEEEGGGEEGSGDGGDDPVDGAVVKIC